MQEPTSQNQPDKRPATPADDPSDSSPATQQAAPEPSASEAISQDAKNQALLNWLGTIFFGFIPGLLFYLLVKGEPFVQAHAKESLNWAITMMFAYIAAFFLSFILIGLVLFPIIGLIHIVVCILGVMAAFRGEAYQAPFAVRLVK